MKTAPMEENNIASLKKITAHAVIEKVPRDVLGYLYSLTYIPVVMHFNRIFLYGNGHVLSKYAHDFTTEFPGLVYESKYRSIPEKNCGRRFHFRNDKSADPRVYCIEVRQIDIDMNTRIIEWLLKRDYNPIQAIELLKPENGMPRCKVHGCCCHDVGVGLSW